MNYFLIKQGWKITNKGWCPHQGSFCTEQGEYVFYDCTDGCQEIGVNWNDYILSGKICKDIREVMKESI